MLVRRVQSAICLTQQWGRWVYNIFPKIICILRLIFCTLNPTAILFSSASTHSSSSCELLLEMCIDGDSDKDNAQNPC